MIWRITLTRRWFASQLLRLISTWAIMELLHSPQNTTCRKWQSTSKINTIVVSIWYIAQIQPVVSIVRTVNTAGRYHVRPIDSTVKLATAFSAVKLTVINFKVTNFAWFACVVCENNVKQNYNEFIIEICVTVISCGVISPNWSFETCCFDR